MSVVLAEPPTVSDRVYAPTPGDVWQTTVSYYGAEYQEIEELELGYEVLRPIPVEIKRADDSTFVARFAEANIAIGGFDAQDAFQSLVAEILDAFDTLTEEAHLTGSAAEQLRVLRAYIAKA